MNLILFGAPGAGKGTQRGSLIDTYQIPAIATGDMLRAQRRAGTALGDQVKSYMDRGELVPDALMIDMIKERLQEPDARTGFILDGFPRTVAQAEALDATLDQLRRRVDAVIYLRVSRQVLIDRLSHRYSCRTCDAVYNFTPKQALEVSRCTAALMSPIRLPSRAWSMPIASDSRVTSISRWASGETFPTPTLRPASAQKPR